MCRYALIAGSAEYGSNNIAGFTHRFIQCLRFRNALRDVSADSYQAGDGSSGVTQWYLGRLQVHQVASRIAALLLAGRQWRTGTNHLLFVLVITGGQVLRMKVKVVLAEQVARRFRAHDACYGDVCQEESAVDILHIDQVRQVVDEDSEHLLLANAGSRAG